VAGYRFSEGITEIKFWDDYLKTNHDQYQWDVELEFDSVVEGWFVVEHT
jgi:hypothetical protein